MAQELVRQVSLSEQIFEIMRKEMESGVFQPGQKLMSETALAQKYGVSRLTVRAAIARLSALDYIETRTGEGSFVKERDSNKLLQTISSIIIKPEMLNDVTDFRKLIDTECVRLAILNATEEDIQRLSGVNEEFSDFLVNGLQTFDKEAQKKIVDLDFEFHLTICEISGNLLYPLVYKAVQEAIKQQICTNFVSRWYFNRMDASNQEDIDKFRMGHVYLLNAIAERDYPKARRIMVAHINQNVMKIPEAKK